ncbi:MAG: fluoride efflux transporter CrcB [Phycisphaeraceae bacterium]|nr:fluoride efflux transporter CrcB [Phycisphaeraceae bacterium]
MPESNVSLLKPVLIFLGAGSGGLLRYWLGGLIQNWWGPTFPLGTLIVNVSGCLAMGFLAAAWAPPGPVLIRDEYRTAVLVGVLGGYTTFSSFGRETLALTHDGEWLRAGGYVFGSVALSLLAVWIGAALAAKLFGAGAP